MNCVCVVRAMFIHYRPAIKNPKCLMPMAQVPEIGAENPYQETDTINRHENTACPIRCRKLIGLPEKNRYQIACHKPVPVSAPVSGKYVVGIK